MRRLEGLPKVVTNVWPKLSGLWDNAGSAFIPFLDYSVEIREVLCSTNAIESLNAFS
ncbi:hypothetical protein Asi02nite_75290 [Asanoa siamensis]|uniref:Mutator family transposase n=1 Tax=Asanoa siamensis TaxID=926357 RepID=A0ABQ4D394_9ACTN|nr:hypothetical protein Asi02nite_75290 [Asanoa siamensis]